MAWHGLRLEAMEKFSNIGGSAYSAEVLISPYCAHIWAFAYEPRGSLALVTLAASILERFECQRDLDPPLSRRVAIEGLARKLKDPIGTNNLRTKRDRVAHSSEELTVSCLQLSCKRHKLMKRRHGSATGVA